MPLRESRLALSMRQCLSVGLATQCHWCSWSWRVQEVRGAMTHMHVLAIATGVDLLQPCLKGPLYCRGTPGSGSITGYSNR